MWLAGSPEDPCFESIGATASPGAPSLDHLAFSSPATQPLHLLLFSTQKLPLAFFQASSCSFLADSNGASSFQGSDCESWSFRDSLYSARQEQVKVVLTTPFCNVC